MIWIQGATSSRCSAAVWPLAARAQQAAMPVIGYLNSVTPEGYPSGYLPALRRGLKESGYVESENVAIEYRWAENQPERLAALAADLVRRQVKVIVAWGPLASMAAVRATATISIVFAVPEDPVRLGLVASLARPGGNATGVNIFAAELAAKRLEFLREFVPSVNRVASQSGRADDCCGQPSRRRSGCHRLGGTNPRFQCQHHCGNRYCLRRSSERAARRSIRQQRPFFPNPARTNRTPGNALRHPRDREPACLPRSRRLNELWHEPDRRTPPSRHLCWPHPEGCETRRSPGRSVDQVRTHHQRLYCQDARLQRAAISTSHRRRGDRVKRRQFITLLGGAAWPLAARVQEAAIPVVGYLHSVSPEANAKFLAGFRKGLAETGYVEGRNVAIEYRWAQGEVDRLPELAADLVRRKVAVIVTEGIASVLAAKAATTTIPIVFGTGADPIQDGLVPRLNRPGGNVTGITSIGVEITPKRLGLLHELLPRAARFAVLVNPNDANAASTITDVRAAASTVGRQIEVFFAS